MYHICIPNWRTHQTYCDFHKLVFIYPIIFQPFKDSYQLLPVHSDETIPVDISPIQRPESEEVMKRDTEAVTVQQLDDETMQKSEDNSHYADEKYPYIFAKFKIDSKVVKEGSPNAKTVQKRESKNPSLFSEKHVNSLKLVKVINLW